MYPVTASIIIERTVDTCTALPEQGSHIDVTGGRVYFIRKGRGAPLVLIHGILSSSFVWRKNIDSLAKDFDVVALDLKGHGRSDSPRDSAFTRESLRLFLGDFLDTLGLEKVSLAGHSWGGGIALDFTLSHPGRVEKLVLLDSTGYGGGNRLAEWLLMRNIFLPALLRVFGRPLVRSALEKSVFHDPSLVTHEEVEGWLRGARAGARTILRLSGYDLVMEGEIGKISRPSLILWGMEDRFMPKEFAGRLHRDIKGSTLKIIEGCGHNPQEERPEEVNGAVREFLLDGGG